MTAFVREFRTAYWVARYCGRSKLGAAWRGLRSAREMRWIKRRMPR